jgi:hypothetical protein
MATMFWAVAIALFALTVEPPAAQTAFSPEQILLNMPVNSDHRCVGISLVAAALLEGELIADDRSDEAHELGGRIYDAAFVKRRVRFRAKLKVGDRDEPIQSRVALDALATAVVDRYKQRHLELIATAEGRNKLWAAEGTVLRDMAELDTLLATDADHIVPLLVSGSRRFSDGSVKNTNHAVLVAKTPAGEKVIHDPNDPGHPISCRFAKTDDGLTVTWTCRYRDTGETTTQQYLMLEADKFFRSALSR